MRLAILLLLFPALVAASFFDHFTGTSLDARWAYAYDGDGVICVNGTKIAGGAGTCSTAVTGESWAEVVASSTSPSTGLIYHNTKIDKSKSQVFLFSIARPSADAFLGAIWLVNSASAPVPAGISTFEANGRMRFGWASGNTVLLLEKWDGSHIRTQWDTATAAWVNGGITITPASLDNYYIVGFEIDGPNARWRGLIYNKDGSGFVNTQGLYLTAMSDWVTWASQEASTDLWLVVGYPYTDIGFANVTRLEWAYHADGTQRHAWFNGKESSDKYRIQHAWGYEGPNGVVEFWIPEDRTTMAIDVGGAGAWDEGTVKDPVVVQDGSTYYMTYGGMNLAGTSIQIGIATASSPNGPWTKATGNPIIPRIAIGNEDAVYNPQLIKDLTEPDSAKRWKILYSGFNDSTSVVRAYSAYCSGPPHTCTWTRSNLLYEPVAVAETIAAAPTGISRTSNVVTVTTTSTHDFVAGTPVYLSGVTGCSTPPNGTFTITSTPTSTTFTFTQTGADETCGGGTAHPYDENGWWRAHAYLYHGRWWLMANPKVMAAPGGPSRTVWATLPNLNSTAVPSHQIIQDISTDCDTSLTSNMTATRTMNVASTAGCQADDWITVDQDADVANIVRSRILRVASGTQLVLYHKLDGLTTTTPARIVSSRSMNTAEESQIQQVGPADFWMLNTCFGAFGRAGASYVGHSENSCLYRSTAGITGPYTLQTLWSPLMINHNFSPSMLHSAENLRMVETPAPPPPAQVRVARF